MCFLGRSLGRAARRAAGPDGAGASGASGAMCGLPRLPRHHGGAGRAGGSTSRRSTRCATRGPLIVAPNHPSPARRGARRLAPARRDVRDEVLARSATSCSGPPRGSRATSPTTRSCGLASRAGDELRLGGHLAALPRGHAHRGRARGPVHATRWRVVSRAHGRAGAGGLHRGRLALPRQGLVRRSRAPAFRFATASAWGAASIRRRTCARSRPSSSATSRASSRRGRRGPRPRTAAVEGARTHPWLSAPRTHLVLIPSYNPGARPSTRRCARRARALGARCGWSWTAATTARRRGSRTWPRPTPGLRVIVLPAQRRQGRGGAARHHARGGRGLHARAHHGLRRPAPGRRAFPAFMAASQRASPRAVVLGVPVFDASAPVAAREGPARLQLVGQPRDRSGCGIGDSLFGFRVYPIADLAAVMRRQPWMRRFDFDPEAAVRLVWRGVPPVNLPAPGALPAARGGRRVALQLLARQRAAHLDAHAARPRLPRAAARLARWRSEAPRSGARRAPASPARGSQRRSPGVVTTVLASAMITSIVNTCGEMTPRSSPTLITTSSISARVFIMMAERARLGVPEAGPARRPVGAPELAGASRGRPAARTSPRPRGCRGCRRPCAAPCR